VVHPKFLAGGERSIWGCMSFLARANRAFEYELVSCVRAKHLIGFVHLSPFARRLLRLALTTRSKDQQRQNTDQPNSYSDAVEKMGMGVRERRASEPESDVEHQSSQFIANFSGFHFALLLNARSSAIL